MNGDLAMITLVTGATGRIGSRFVPRLLADGAATRVLVRSEEAAESLRRRGADAVVHLAAAFRGVPDEEAIAVNQTASLDLARSAIAAGVSRFVLASTNLVYGPGRGRPARESDPVSPAGAYPESKVAAEDGLRGLWQSDGLGLRVVRLAFVYGERAPHLAES